MSAPKLIPQRDDMIDDVLDGWVLAHPDLIARDSHGHIVRTQPKDEGKVAVVIGNGTGHEPAVVGFIGPGLLDLNVAGPIFAAPGAEALAAGIRAADRGGGVLLCVSNHQGDVLAAELAESLVADDAEPPAVQVAVLGEDIGAPAPTRNDRRGGAGLLFVWKMLGAYAEEGHSLDSCHRLAQRIVDSTASLSAIVRAAEHPLTGVPLASIPPGHVLIGSGVHGEGTGLEPLPSVEQLVDDMVARLMRDEGLCDASHVSVVINDMGGLTGLELGYLTQRVHHSLTDRSIAVDRTWFGRYATTIDSAGFAIALCAMDGQLLRLWDSDARGAAWSR